MNRIEANLALIAGGTITLKADEPNVSFQTLTLDSNFNIYANPGPITIQRSVLNPFGPAFRLLSVNQDTESHFIGITLQNGATTGSGGGVWNDGTAQFSSCMFTNNSAGTDGGAIVARDGATTRLFSCTLTNNSASRDGGAIAALPGSLATSLEDCTLTDNSTVARGGAVFAEGAGSLAVSGGSITNNKTTGVVAGQGFGGGVYVKNTTSATVSYTDISSNTASFAGGGLFVQDCGLSMTGGSLSSNTAAQDGGGFYIDADTKTITLSSVSISNNAATAGKGGGGYLLKGTLTGSLSALMGNTSGVAGFAGIAWKTGSTATITVPPGQQTVVNDL